MNRVRRLLLGAAAVVLALAPVAWSATASSGSSGSAADDAADDASAARETAEATRDRMAAADIVDLPVSFTVENVNRTEAACSVDGETYTVRGHLTAPAALLEGDGDQAITLYQHGIAAGEWYWRVDVEGYHHTEEMAKRGYASLTIDRLGYDSSDHPDGTDTCVGGQADITHQIVQQLRHGTYGIDASGETDGDEPAAFEQVFLAGQSNGGQIVQIAAYSFDDVDGVVIMDWADRGLTSQANARFFTSLQTCLNGGTNGYAYYDMGSQEFEEGNFNDTEPEVLEAAVPQQNRHPCGDMVSQLGAVMTDLDHLQDITVPVLFMYAEEDSRVQGGEEQQALFTGSDDTQLVNVPDAGHYMGLSRNASMVHDSLADWLGQHGA